MYSIHMFLYYAKIVDGQELTFSSAILLYRIMRGQALQAKLLQGIY